MKFITLTKKHILTFFMVLIFSIVVLKISTVFGMQHYYNVDFSTGLVTASILNVRSGPRYKI